MDHYDFLDTPIGGLTLVVDERGRAAAVELQARHPAGAVRSPQACRELRRQLEEYFAGRRRAFAVPLLLRGTSFQQAVWAELLRVPWGQTVSYGELARRAGRPRAARAVGQAMRANPLAILVPCHRVLAAGGGLGGYGGGPEMKRRLLALEGAPWGGTVGSPR